MANNDIQIIKSTDILASSMDTINSNFKSLKDSIGSSGNSVIGVDKKIQTELDNIKTDFDEKLSAALSNRDTEIDNIKSRLSILENTVAQLNDVLSKYGDSD